MKKSSFFSLLAACAATLLAAGSARANNVLVNQQGAVFPTDPANSATQTGRLVRNAIPQDFSGTEAYPGTNNPTITFNYITLTLTPAQLQGGPYVQIELDSQGAGLFVSAYANAYNPVSASNPGGNFQTNWLGDQGSSGNSNFTTLPIAAPDINFFGVTVPTGSSLVIVIATAGAASGTTGTGTGTPYNLLVENFGSTTYGPLAAVPEPSSLMVLGAGALGVGFAVRRRFLKPVA